MSKDVYKVLFAQFLTAFADNAVLFAAITMVMQTAKDNPWYVPALQASFLVAFVLLAPWVGPYADARSKPKVLMSANLVKAIGALLLVINVEPMLAYGVIGIGAAMYSPAKYGILPELVSADELVKANGWIESSTILAIVTGQLAGAFLSEFSVFYALLMVLGLFVASALMALTISRIPAKGADLSGALGRFGGMLRTMLSTPRARFSTLAVSLFWAASVVLRVLLVAWVPVVLFMTETSDIALLTVFVAFGIAVGAVLAHSFIPLTYLRRARLAAYAMGFVVMLLSFIQLQTVIDPLWLARVGLFLAGIAGGMFVVPINAALQEIGHKTIGSGGAVGIQNFFENLAMLLASGLYAWAAGLGAGPVSTMFVLGVLVMLATFIVSWHLPEDTASVSQLLPPQDDKNKEV